MDDTICHLIPKAIHYHNLEYKDPQLTLDQITDYNLHQIWHPECSEEFFFGKPGLYEELELFDEYTIDEVHRMTHDYDVIVVTAARPPRCLRNGDGRSGICLYSVREFFVAKRKDLVEFDLLIDDGPHNAIAARKAGKQTILIPRPWNAHIQHEFILKDS